jgi:IS30 family transposase
MGSLTEETANGLVRQYIPKKHHFTKLCDDDIKLFQSNIESCIKMIFQPNCPSRLFRVASSIQMLSATHDSINLRLFLKLPYY